MVCEIGKAVGAEGLVAGQIVDIKSEGMADKVTHLLGNSCEYCSTCEPCCQAVMLRLFSSA